MVTRCPACGTAFRVQPAQLAAQSGTVRCGKCGELFNGVASLVAQSEQPLTLEPSPQLGLFDPSRRPAEAPRQAEQGPPPPFMAEPRRPRRALWAMLSVLALLALAAQVGYRYRAEVAAMMPAARAPLASLCRSLGCQVPLPRRPELMSIDSSELQADDRREGLISLNAVIHNRAAFSQAYPSLELTLTDEADRPVLRRVLTPNDYLDSRAQQLVSQGIGPGAITTVRVLLDTSRTPATGYRLYLFYPS
ncbi:MAG TPA: DUF3426 domain-containing protein [Burkholderiales bacterium]